MNQHNQKVSELISSGILEAYCMGVTTEDERTLVSAMAAQHDEVKQEIMAINESMISYASTFDSKPSQSIRSIILSKLAPDPEALPPILDSSATVEQWSWILKEKNLFEPDSVDYIHLVDLPGNQQQVTYAAWAVKGAFVEEVHDDEDESLFLIRGTCMMTINGVVSHHKAGDLIRIKPGYVHRAEVTSDELMLIIGQRLAA